MKKLFLLLLLLPTLLFAQKSVPIKVRSAFDSTVLNPYKKAYYKINQSLDSTYFTIQSIDGLQIDTIEFKGGSGIIGNAHQPIYGSFYNDTVSINNSITVISFKGSYLSNGLTLGTDSSKIITSLSGKYKFDFRANGQQMYLTTIWIKVNGIDIPTSGTTFQPRGDAGLMSASGTAIVNLNAGDYVQFGMNSISPQDYSNLISYTNSPAFLVTVYKLEGDASQIPSLQQVTTSGHTTSDSIVLTGNGIKFPDGTYQSTSAVNSSPFVYPDVTLHGPLTFDWIVNPLTSHRVYLANQYPNFKVYNATSSTVNQYFVESTTGPGLSYVSFNNINRLARDFSVGLHSANTTDTVIFAGLESCYDPVTSEHGVIYIDSSSISTLSFPNIKDEFRLVTSSPLTSLYVPAYKLNSHSISEDIYRSIQLDNSKLPSLLGIDSIKSIYILGVFTDSALTGPVNLMNDSNNIIYNPYQSITFDNCPLLTSFTANHAATIGYIDFENNAAITSIDCIMGSGFVSVEIINCPSLTSVPDFSAVYKFAQIVNTGLTSLNLASMGMGGASYINYGYPIIQGNRNLTSINMPIDGFLLPSIGNVDIGLQDWSGNALDQTTIDMLINYYFIGIDTAGAYYVGTTSFNFSGGTNSPPSSASAYALAALRAMGVTVLTN